MQVFDIVLGMDWLKKHQAHIDCAGQKVTFIDSRKELVTYTGGRRDGVESLHIKAL